MLQSDVVKGINQQLLTLYGLDVHTPLPKFRVVWSTDQIEKRKFDEFNTFTDSGIFLRREKNVVKEVPKYRDFPDCWILERLQPNRHQDVADGSFLYEPIWVFRDDATGLPLPVNYKVVDFILAHLFHKVKGQDERPKNQKELDAQEEKELEASKQEIRDSIDTTVIESALHDGDGISLAGLDIPKSENADGK